MEITLSPIGTLPPTPPTALVSTDVPAIPPREPSTPAHIPRGVSPVPLRELSTPAHVSRGVSPIPLGEPSTAARVSRGVSPVAVIDLFPPDFSLPITGLLDTTQEELNSPLLSPQVIVSDLQPETHKAPIPLKGPASPEVISETEPESDSD